MSQKYAEARKSKQGSVVINFQKVNSVFVTAYKFIAGGVIKGYKAASGKISESAAKLRAAKAARKQAAQAVEPAAQAATEE
jgi:hypothetical protein